jgi:glycosyltransferase involved in cell wall biosynthesis
MNITVITASWRIDGLKNVIKNLEDQIFKNWNHIIINDNSSDIRKFLEQNKYFEDDPKRHIIDFRVRTHYYGAFARNTGAMISFSFLAEKYRSESEWIVFMDDDNIFYPNYLTTFVEMHIEKPTATLLGIDMEIMSKKNNDYVGIKQCEILPGKADLGMFAYKRSLFDKYGYFQARPEKKNMYDFELIKKMADGEGDRVYIKHQEKPTWTFYSKKFKL